MAELNINIVEGIYAEIVGGDKTVLKNYPLILDPISKSYSSYADLIKYTMKVKNSVGLSDVVLLHNGKNSRFSASGVGSCQIELYIEDDLGYSDTDLITITVI